MNKVIDSWLKRYFSNHEAIVLGAIFIATILIFKVMGNVLVPVIVSIAISYLLFSLVKKLEKIGFSTTIAAVLVFILFIGLLLLILLWLLPVCWNEIVRLVAEIPNMLSRAQELIARMQTTFPMLGSMEEILQHQVTMIGGYLLNSGSHLVSFSATSLVSIVTVITYLILVPLLIFFFLRDGRKIASWASHFLPKRRHVLNQLWQELQVKLRCYIYGKLVEIIIVSAISIISFRMLGLRYAVLFGSLAGLAGLVPYIGTVVVTIPIVIVALVQWGGTEHFLYILLAHGIISILNANLLVPMLFSEVMNLHPLAIILAVLIFGSLFGLWGIVFAIPLVTMADLILQLWPRGEE